jgi:hypothetical protein
MEVHEHKEMESINAAMDLVEVLLLSEEKKQNGSLLKKFCVLKLSMR